MNYPRDGRLSARAGGGLDTEHATVNPDCSSLHRLANDTRTCGDIALHLQFPATQDWMGRPKIVRQNAYDPQTPHSLSLLAHDVPMSRVLSRSRLWDGERARCSLEIETEKLPLAAEEGKRMGWADLLSSPRWANREGGREGKRRNVLHFNRHINLRRDN